MDKFIRNKPLVKLFFLLLVVVGLHCALPYCFPAFSKEIGTCESCYYDVALGRTYLILPDPIPIGTDPYRFTWVILMHMPVYIPLEGYTFGTDPGGDHSLNRSGCQLLPEVFARKLMNISYILDLNTAGLLSLRTCMNNKVHRKYIMINPEKARGE